LLKEYFNCAGETEQQHFEAEHPEFGLESRTALRQILLTLRTPWAGVKDKIVNNSAYVKGLEICGEDPVKFLYNQTKTLRQALTMEPYLLEARINMIGEEYQRLWKDAIGHLNVMLDEVQKNEDVF